MEPPRQKCLVSMAKGVLRGPFLALVKRNGAEEMLQAREALGNALGLKQQEDETSKK